MRILVAGGAGFIGSHLCDRLLADGHQVVCVDNLITGRRENVAHLGSHSGFEFVEQDVSRDLDVPEPVEYVCNLASPASPFDYLEHPVETLMAGSAGTKNLLDIALRDKAGFLMASTSECYGDPEERFAEAVTMAYHRKHGVNTRIVRIFNTYGPRMKLRDGRVVPAFIDQALAGKPLTVFGDGSQTRSFCYVSDLVEGLVRLMGSAEHLPVNIGNPNELTILEFAKRIQEEIGTANEILYKPLPEDDPKQRRPDITRARKLLGWEPKVTLAEGLARTVAHFRETQDGEGTAGG